MDTSLPQFESNAVIDNADPGDLVDLLEAACALLLRIENMTTEEFSRGGEKEPRDRLRRVLTRIGAIEDDGNG